MLWFTRLRAWLRDQRSTTSSKTSRERKLRLMELEPRQMLSGYHFDFGTATSSRANDYTRVEPVGYSESRGYGWASPSNVSAVNRDFGDALGRDFHKGTDNTFKLDLPNGTYQVNLSLGDHDALRDRIDIYINGNRVASGLSTSSGQFTKPVYQVKVTDGQLRIRLVDTGGSTSGWALSALDAVLTEGPIGSTGPNRSGNEGSAISFQGSASGTGSLKYKWDFGDGTTTTGSLTPKHTYADNGTYKVRLTVTDGNGTCVNNYATVRVANVAPRPNALGKYYGNVDQPVHFVGIAKDPSPKDLAAGYTYKWNFGDGATATGAAVDHIYSKSGTYKVTMTVVDKDGGTRSTTTSAVIAAGSDSASRNDYSIVGTNLIANTVLGYLNWSEMASTGAWGANAKWEQGNASEWHIELQRYGEDLITGGLIHNNTSAISAGLKAFDWGFARQRSDGSFSGTADPFHSTSLFVEAVANAVLVLKQSPLASTYRSKIDSYTNRLDKAAQWMTSSSIWSNGVKNNSPYTHRRYIVADALAMTSKLVGGDSRLLSYARSQISSGLAAQWDNGVNPELGGYDSSYQTLGISYATRWVTYFPNDSLTQGVKRMISKALAWEETKIKATGQIDTSGSVRTGVEDGPSGTTKTVDWKKAVDAFAYWYQRTGDKRWQLDAQKIAQFYYMQY
mgnify:CR=1 FL=1